MNAPRHRREERGATRLHRKRKHQERSDHPRSQPPHKPTSEQRGNFDHHEEADGNLPTSDTGAATTCGICFALRRRLRVSALAAASISKPPSYAPPRTSGATPSATNCQKTIARASQLAPRGPILGIVQRVNGARDETGGHDPEGLWSNSVLARGETPSSLSLQVDNQDRIGGGQAKRVKLCETRRLPSYPAITPVPIATYVTGLAPQGSQPHTIKSQAMARSEKVCPACHGNIG